MPSSRTRAVTRWLVVTRAAVLPMTLVSGLVAALLAIGEPGRDWRLLVLSLIGITLAHVANNLMNDLFDTQVGTDSAGYPRALYSAVGTVGWDILLASLPYGLMCTTVLMGKHID